MTIDLSTIPPLDTGTHSSLAEGACIMEAVSYIAGEPYSDEPACVCPMIGAFLRAWNDELHNGERDAILRPLIPLVLNTRSTAAVERRRALLAADWLVRTHTPVWLRLAGWTAHADALAELPEITDMAQCPSMLPVLTAVDDEANAAWTAATDAAQYANAAWDAAWANARDASWDTARNATWDEAQNSAWDAAWDASRKAARDEAENGIWCAADQASRSAFLTVGQRAAVQVVYEVAKAAAPEDFAWDIPSPRVTDSCGDRAWDAAWVAIRDASDHAAKAVAVAAAAIAGATAYEVAWEDAECAAWEPAVAAAWDVAEAAARYPARAAGAAARAAAWANAWDGRYGIRDAWKDARAAGETITQDLAWSLQETARAADWEDAEVDAWEAAMNAAQDPARAALESTRLELQQSALALVHRMIAVTGESA